ncbi:hypothetical protein BVI434_250005 [Burkholderia vietnamiensis]|nr:hypothetical protein BVI434_250005 [Burkholderia vietnamiensis]
MADVTPPGPARRFASCSASADRCAAGYNAGSNPNQATLERKHGMQSKLDGSGRDGVFGPDRKRAPRRDGRRAGRRRT